jgi:hypothetical protein
MAQSWAGGESLLATATNTATNGTEAAPEKDAVVGINLCGPEGAIGGITVHVECASNMTANAFVDIYVQNPRTGNWNLCNDIVLKTGAQKTQAFPGFDIKSPRSRLAAVPRGLGVASTIDLVATRVY